VMAVPLNTDSPCLLRAGDRVKFFDA